MPNAYATEQLTSKSAILAIIGEAEGENYLGKVIIGEIIRRRGSLKGVYGANSRRVKQHLYSQATYDECKKAWKESARTNYSEHADGWGNAADLVVFRRSAWFKKCYIVKQVGSHYLWKEKSN